MRVFSYFKRAKSASPPPMNGADALARELSATADATVCTGYFRYLLTVFRGTSPYALWQRARAAFAPAVFLSRCFRILRWIFRIVEASALFLFASVLFLLITPFLLALALAFVAAAALAIRRADRALAPLICARRVLVLFSWGNRKGAFAAFAGEYAVLAVTPLFSSPDTGTGRFSIFSAAKVGRDGVILVREYYYFHLAKTLLREAAFCARVY